MERWTAGLDSMVDADGPRFHGRRRVGSSPPLAMVGAAVAVGSQARLLRHVRPAGSADNGGQVRHESRSAGPGGGKREREPAGHVSQRRTKPPWNVVREVYCPVLRVQGSQMDGFGV
jgi:hypothetical protein